MANPRQYHLAADFTLQKWYQAGDPLADFELYHRRTVHQMVLDVSADPPTFQEPRCYVVYLEAKAPLYFLAGVFGRQHITLLLDPQTSLEAIQRHWSEIRAWQRRLQRWQGDHYSRAAAYLNNFKGWHQIWVKGTKGSPSLAQLARLANLEIAVELEGALETIRDVHGDTPSIPLEGLLEFPSWRLPRDHWAYPLAHPIWMLEQWGFSRDEIKTWCLYGIKNMKAGKPPFGDMKPTYPDPGKPAFRGPNCPIDRDRIKDKLKRLTPEQ